MVCSVDGSAGRRAYSAAIAVAAQAAEAHCMRPTERAMVMVPEAASHVPFITR
jgi:hypothetical protein